jgi:hypothetical protein
MNRCENESYPSETLIDVEGDEKQEFQVLLGIKMVIGKRLQPLFCPS